MAQLNKNIVTLIGGGCTHNFIQDQVVKFLVLQVSQSSKFDVMVGNGDKLLCNSSFTNVLVMLGNNQFLLIFTCYQLVVLILT